MSRPQFSLKTLLWLMIVAAAFLGGIHVEHRRHDTERRDWINTTMGQHELNMRLGKENLSLHRQLRESPHPTH